MERKRRNAGQNTAQKMKFFVKHFFSKCDQIRSFLVEVSNYRIVELCNGFVKF